MRRNLKKYMVEHLRSLRWQKLLIYNSTAMVSCRQTGMLGDLYARISKLSCFLVYENKIFANLSFLIIIASAILVGVESYKSLESNRYLTIADLAVVLFFTAEIIMKICAAGKRPWRYFTGNDRIWNVFDFVIVFFSWPYMNTFFSGQKSIYLLRLVRLARIGKIFTRIHALRATLMGLIQGLSSLLSIGVLLLLILYVYGILGYYLFSANDPFHFGSLPRSMLTLCRIALFDNCGDVIYLNMYGCDVYPDVYVSVTDKASYNGMFRCTKPEAHFVDGAFYFISYIFFASFIVLSLVVGVVSTSMAEAIDKVKMAEVERQSKILCEQHRHKAMELINTIDFVNATKRALIAKVQASLLQQPANELRVHQEFDYSTPDNTPLPNNSPQPQSARGVDADPNNHIAEKEPVINVMKIDRKVTKFEKFRSYIEFVKCSLVDPPTAFIKWVKSNELEFAQKRTRRMTKVYLRIAMGHEERQSEALAVRTGTGDYMSGLNHVDRLGGSHAYKENQGASMTVLRSFVSSERVSNSSWNHTPGYRDDNSGGSDRNIFGSIIRLDRAATSLVRVVLPSFMGSWSFKSQNGSQDVIFGGDCKEDELSVYSRLAESCYLLNLQPWVAHVLTAFIILSCVNMGMAMNVKFMMDSYTMKIVEGMDSVVVAVFTLEAVVKLVAEDFYPWRYFYSPFNVFDFAIVICGFFPGVKYVRLLRLLRILRLVQEIRELRLLLDASLTSVGSIVYVTIFLGIFFYVYGLMGVLLFGRNDPFRFRDLNLAVIALFRALTLDNTWDLMYTQIYGCDTYRGIYTKFPAMCNDPQVWGSSAVVFFLTFIGIGVQVLLTLFVGVVTTGMITAEGLRNREVIDDALVNHIAAKLSLNRERVEAFKKLFKILDVRKDGVLEEYELKMGLESLAAIAVSSRMLRSLLDKVDPKREGLGIAKFIKFISLLPRFKRPLSSMFSLKPIHVSRFCRARRTLKAKLGTTTISSLDKYFADLAAAILQRKWMAYKQIRRRSYVIDIDSNPFSGKLRLRPEDVIAKMASEYAAARNIQKTWRGFVYRRRTRIRTPSIRRYFNNFSPSSTFFFRSSRSLSPSRNTISRFVFTPSSNRSSASRFVFTPSSNRNELDDGASSNNSSFFDKTPSSQRRASDRIKAFFFHSSLTGGNQNGGQVAIGQPDSAVNKVEEVVGGDDESVDVELHLDLHTHSHRH